MNNSDDPTVPEFRAHIEGMRVFNCAKVSCLDPDVTERRGTPPTIGAIGMRGDFRDHVAKRAKIPAIGDADTSDPTLPALEYADTCDRVMQGDAANEWTSLNVWEHKVVNAMRERERHLNVTFAKSICTDLELKRFGDVIVYESWQDDAYVYVLLYGEAPINGVRLAFGLLMTKTDGQPMRTVVPKNDTFDHSGYSPQTGISYDTLLAMFQPPAYRSLSATEGVITAGFPEAVRIRVRNAAVLEHVGDAIVNAANEGMEGGGGVDGAITSAGGSLLRALRKACSDVRPGVKCPTGWAVLTGVRGPVTLGTLRVPNVINAVGPDFGSDPNAWDTLRAAYDSAIAIARSENLKSVGFPLLSVGIFAGRADRGEIVRVAIKSLLHGARDGLDLTIYAFTEWEFREVQKQAARCSFGVEVD